MLCCVLCVAGVSVCGYFGVVPWFGWFLNVLLICFDVWLLLLVWIVFFCFWLNFCDLRFVSDSFAFWVSVIVDSGGYCLWVFVVRFLMFSLFVILLLYD